MRKSKKKSVKIIKKVLDREGCHYHEEGGMFEFGMRVSEEVGGIGCKWAVTDDGVGSYAVFPNSAFGKCRDRIVELITRINVPLGQGHFELDYADGEIRFVHWLSAEELYDSPREKLNGFLGVTDFALTKFGPAIMRVMLGEKAETAFSRAMTEESSEGSLTKAEAQAVKELIAEELCEQSGEEPPQAVFSTEPIEIDDDEDDDDDNDDVVDVEATDEGVGNVTEK